MSKILFAFLVFLSISSFAQVPVPMASQPMLTYIETFDSINTWTNNFSSGHGANRFTSVAVGGNASIPDPTRITTNSSSFVTSQMSAGGLYKDTVNGRLLMLVTGTSNNTNSLAIDFHLDFTNINAGSLSFEWETVFNGTSTSNRTGTLKVYESDNGTNFTELSAASITVTNNIAINGNVINVALPSSFNGSSTAVLRFYYYNSAGGSTGSRPAIALDNIKVTASANPCITPVVTPTNLVFNNVAATSISGNFTPAFPSPDEYMVVASSFGALTSYPVDSTVYTLGDNIGDGILIYQGSGNSFTATNLNPSTTYTFYVFPVNLYCNGALKYQTQNVLTGVQVTPAGPPCPTPTQQPSNLQLTNVTTTSMDGSFSPSVDASEYLVVVSTNSALTANPLNTIVYDAGDALGGGIVVYRGGATNFSVANLTHSTTYHFFVFSINNFACSGGPVYLTGSPLTAQKSTNILLPCTTPAKDANNLILQPDVNSITGFFNPGDGVTDAYMVLMSTGNSLSSLPQDGVLYALGSVLGNATIISTGKNYSFHAANLAGQTNYYFFIVPYNTACIGGPLYKTNSILQDNAVTTTIPQTNHYFGNLHSHSSHSDGNQDDKTKTPYDDYEFAQNALCMDFLGISEHNHYSANNNPGMTLAEYYQGITDATNYTIANPNFLALYGMEWGTLTNGGHVLVYGIDSLIGWEIINGNPNYDIYIPKNDFTSSTGLFSKINSFNSLNAFSSLAHPSFNDYQKLTTTPYNASVDSALVGVAIESGPAFSTNASYNEPGSNMEFLYYYQILLSKGYRVGPMIDHDNHNMTFGRTANSRTAVIANSISKTDFIHAMRNMRFYATQDCNTKANIKIFGQEMGSEMSHQFAPAINITTENSVSSAAPIIRLMYGVSGSGIAPVEIASINGSNMNYTDNTLQPNKTAYYYADISYGSKRTITAPIWYTRLADPLTVENIVNKSSLNNVSIIENPVNEELKLKIVAHESGSFEVVILNISGQKIQCYSTSVTKGSQEMIFSTNGIVEGMYVLESRFANEIVRMKFMK